MTPTGGNGGKGGNVYVRVNSQLDVLSLPKSAYKAEDGANGRGKCQHGRGGHHVYIDIPIGTLVYELTTHNLPDTSRWGQEAKASFDQQMYARLGAKYDEIKAAEKAEEEMLSENEVSTSLLFDSAFSQHGEVFCVAQGGVGGEGNHDWYERSKRQNLRYWGSNRDRRLQASYYKVGSIRKFHLTYSMTNLTTREDREKAVCFFSKCSILLILVW